MKLLQTSTNVTDHSTKTESLNTEILQFSEMEVSQTLTICFQSFLPQQLNRFSFWD